MKKLFPLMVLIMLPISASAYVGEAVVDGINYYIITKIKTAEVRSNHYTGNIVIPSTIEYDGVVCNVTSIGNEAFRFCSDLTSVTIPGSVTSIGEYAFAGCTGLTSISIPKNVTSIGNYAFYGCSGPTSITIPSRVTTIDKYAFYGCTGLTSVNIPGSVTSIGEYAFSKCSGLTSITIPESITKINIGTFSNCTGLTSIEIPNSVTYINNSAFSECSSLTSATIGSNVTDISNSSFAQCSSLKEIKIFVTDKSAFCNNQVVGILRNTSYINNMPINLIDSQRKEIKEYVIPDDVTSIGEHAFSGCAGLTSIEIPNSVTSISEHAFYKCTGLSTVTIPSSVATISKYAFSESSKLNTVIIEDGVTSIDKYAFYGCTGLTSVNIPGSVTSIGEYAFSKCSGLTSITIPESITKIDIGNFSGCTGLISVNIPNSVTAINGYAFSGCTGLTSINIPNSVTFIGICAFNGCIGLASVTIPNSVHSIRGNAFSSCSCLTSIAIGSGVEYIYYQAFAKCPELTDVYCYAVNVPSMRNNNGTSVTDGFKDSYIEYATLHVPEASVQDYKAIEPWKNFKEIVSINASSIYKLTYVVDGVTYKEYIYKEGTVITPEPAPNKEGYEFSGWSEIPETMPAKDVTITGTFSEIILGKCATPTISLKDGKIVLDCETEGVEYVPQIIPLNESSYDNGKIELANSYRITVYATKKSYENSDVVTKDIKLPVCTQGDVDGNGKVNVADHVELTKIIMRQ